MMSAECDNKKAKRGILATVVSRGLSCTSVTAPER